VEYFKPPRNDLMPAKATTSKRYRFFVWGVNGELSVLANLISSGSHKSNILNSLYIENDAAYQSSIRNAIRSVPMPVTIRPDTLDDVVAYAETSERQPHHLKYVRNRIVTPPPKVKKALDAFWMSNIVTPKQDSRLSREKPKVNGCLLQDLYRLWWVSGDICNISGVLGSWEANSALKLTFDRIIPGAKGGTYEWWNLQVVLVAVNTAKWDFSQEETINWMETYKQAGV
jgi:hypothetical protein